jgi:hypothetical protein
MRISSRKEPLDVQTEAYVERRMRFALTRFAPLVDEVEVTLRDETGPRGAPAKTCRVAVRLQRSGAVIAESTDASFESAASRAAERASRTVARQLHRKRHIKQYYRRRTPDEGVGA